MIAMTVRNQHILDFGGVQPLLLEPNHDLGFGRVLIKRVDYDDAITGIQSPRGVEFGAEEIKIVKNLLRLRVPDGAAWIGVVVANRGANLRRGAVAREYPNP